MKTLMKIKSRQNQMLKSQFDIAVENEVRKRMKKVSIKTTRQIKINRSKKDEKERERAKERRKIE